MRKTLRERCQIMLQARYTHGLKIASNSPFGGSGLWIEGPHGLDADQLASNLRNDGVIIDRGTPIFLRNQLKCRFFRLGFPAIQSDRIEEDIALLAKRLAGLC